MIGRKNDEDKEDLSVGIHTLLKLLLIKLFSKELLAHSNLPKVIFAFIGVTRDFTIRDLGEKKEK